MRDDLGITTRIENGKAYLEFTLPEKLREGDACGGRLRIVIREAGDGRQIFCGEYDPGELEPMTALLLRPHLWNGCGIRIYMRWKPAGTSGWMTR